MPLFLSFDLGTSYFKVGVFDEHGALRGMARIAVDKLSPLPGRFELPVDLFWERLRHGLHIALEQANARPDEVAGISYSSQANTFVLLDAADLPLTPLIFWNDQRAAPIDDALASFGTSEAFARTAGFCGFTAEFAPFKWKWFKENQPDVWRRTVRIMTISDYFAYSLTREPFVDSSTAAFTGLFDVKGEHWWDQALAAFEIPLEKLSQPIRAGAPCGRTSSRRVTPLSLPAGIPFAIGAFDHLAAAIGSGVDRFAEASISIGTVLAALSLVEEVVPVPECYHGPHIHPGRFYRLAFDRGGAGQLEEYQREYAPSISLPGLLHSAANAPPMSFRGRDHGDGASNPDHAIAVRRLLEKSCAAQRSLVQKVTTGSSVRMIAATGGGARSPIWMQIMADVLGVSISTPGCTESACLGAATFAGVAAGVFNSPTDANLAMVSYGQVFYPVDRMVDFYRDPSTTGQP